MPVLSGNARRRQGDFDTPCFFFGADEGDRVELPAFSLCFLFKLKGKKKEKKTEINCPKAGRNACPAAGSHVK